MADHGPRDRVLTAEMITAVSLSRGSCNGMCPVYGVTLSTTGLAAYEGEAFVERVGRYRGRVDREDVRDLVGFILRLGFAELEPEYLPPGTCLPTKKLELWSGRWSRRVVDHGSAPPEFWAMAALVDAVVERAWWEPATARDPFPEGPPGEWPDPEPDADETDGDLPPDGPTVDEQEGTEASGSAATATALERRADGKVYCCDTLGWVDEATAFDHRWDTSRPLEEYLSERAFAWDGVKPGE